MIEGGKMNVRLGEGGAQEVTGKRKKKLGRWVGTDGVVMLWIEE